MKLYLLAAILFLNACGGPSTSEPAQPSPAAQASAASPEYDFPYDVEHPTSTMELPKELAEISGLSLGEDGSIYAVQDEKGYVFRIQGEDVKQFEFRKDGDYEGIEVVGDKAYVVKNSGTIYQVGDLGADNQSREDYNDFLTGAHNVEGLCYHPGTNSLLLACKDTGEKKGLETGLRSIYRFDLETMKMQEKPFFSIESKAVEMMIKHRADAGDKHFQKLMRKKGESLAFGPSGIAIHPRSKHFYILSAKSNLLIVTDETGQPLGIRKLPKGIHEQPEGICFDSDGKMFISNEAGNEDHSVIYQFSPR